MANRGVPRTYIFKVQYPSLTRSPETLSTTKQLSFVVILTPNANSIRLDFEMYNGRETLQCHELVNTQLYFATKCDNKKQDLSKLN